MENHEPTRRYLQCSASIEVWFRLGTGDVLGPASATFAAGSSQGTQIAPITGLTAGETSDTISPNDGRLALDVTRRVLLVGSSAAAAGVISAVLTKSAGCTLNMGITVAGAVDPGPFPAFAPAFLRVTADNPANTVETTDQTFAPSDVDTANGKIALGGLTYLAFSTFTSAAATRVFFSSTGTLPLPLQSGVPYYLSPAAGGGFDIYPEAATTDWVATPTMLPEDTAYPAQNFAQRVNKIVLTSQGSGTHRIVSNPLVKELANQIAAKPAYKVQTRSSDRHNRWEVVTDAQGKKALSMRRLVRDPTMAAAYSVHGFGMDFGPSDQRIAFQTESRSKRSLVKIDVMQWDETDTKGVAKAPILSAGVNTTTGVLTYSGQAPGPGFVTGRRARLLAHSNGGVLPAGLSGGAQDYSIRVSGSTYTLHAASADATGNVNPIIPTSQGSVGFIIYCPEQPADVERMRFTGEWREPVGGGNSLTVRSNAAQYGDVTQVLATDVVVSGTTNGQIGATGRTAVGLFLGDNTRIVEVRLEIPAGCVPPARQDGSALSAKKYWARRVPNSSAFYMLYDDQALCHSDATALRTVAASSCIKFNGAAPVGFMRVEQSATRPFNGQPERGSSTMLPPNGWGPPIGVKGVLVTVADYNDSASTGIRSRMYWNGVLVADYDNGGTKGATGSGTNAADSGFTLGNSPQRHVPMEGLLYEVMLGASDGEITQADIAPINNWLMAKHGIVA